MPLLHCPYCHHEWETYGDNPNCDWCKDRKIVSVGYVIAEKTDLEKMDLNKILEEIKKKEKGGNNITP